MAVGRSGDLPTATPASHEEKDQSWQESGERDVCALPNTIRSLGFISPGLIRHVWNGVRSPRSPEPHTAIPREGDGDRVAAKARQESCQHREMPGRHGKRSEHIRKARGETAAPPGRAWKMLQGISSRIRCAALSKAGRCSGTSALHSSCARQPRPWQRSPSSRSTQWAQTSAETFWGINGARPVPAPPLIPRRDPPISIYTFASSRK